MRRFLLALLLFSCASAWAQASTQTLSKCLAETATGKDRKELARWVFFAMASNPDIKQFTTNSTEAAAIETHKNMADLFMRLLSESCNSQAQAAYREGDAKAIEVVLKTLGELAMEELTQSLETTSSMAGFRKHLDLNKLTKVLGGS